MVSAVMRRFHGDDSPSCWDRTSRCARSGRTPHVSAPAWLHAPFSHHHTKLHSWTCGLDMLPKVDYIDHRRWAEPFTGCFYNSDVFMCTGL